MAAQAPYCSPGSTAITGVIVWALPFLQVKQWLYLDVEHFVCLVSIYSAEDPFSLAQWLLVQYVHVNFARVFQPLDISSLAISGDLHWSPIDFCLLNLRRKYAPIRHEEARSAELCCFLGILVLSLVCVCYSMIGVVMSLYSVSFWNCQIVTLD